MWTPIRPGAAWGDVATLTPWTLYERFGDAGILAAQYDERERGSSSSSGSPGADRLWDEGFQLGDWLDPPPRRRTRPTAQTDRYLVATAYFAALGATASPHGRGARPRRRRRALRPARRRGARGVPRALRAARRPDDERRADRLRARDRVRPRARPRERATRRARASPNWSREAGHRIATGFVGTPLVSDALTVTRASSEPRTTCCSRTRVPVVAVPGDGRAPRRSGSAGTACCPTARSTRAR